MVYGSPISLWEVSNKCRKGKLQLKFSPRESGLTGFSNGIS